MRSGLKFICRDSFDPLRRSQFDAPLASRFEEMDCVVIFDNVLVPWERVFLCGDVARCNALYGETSAVVHMMHQVVVKNVAKSGIRSRPRGANRRGEPTRCSLPHVRERLAEMITTTETMRACLRAAEADAAVDKWGVMRAGARRRSTPRATCFRSLYPRMVEIIQLNSSSHR